MVKELPIAGDNITLGGLISDTYLLVSKTGSAFDGKKVVDNIYTKATISGRTQTNPVFEPTIKGGTVTLTRINTNPVEDHMDLKSATIIQYTIKGRFMSR